MNTEPGVEEVPGPDLNFKGYAESESEKLIYSYVQVPLEYYPDPAWTGEWIDIEAGGQKFFYFGCGICCLSNIYSTMTEGHADPGEMFDMAKEGCAYNPDSGLGALSWKQLKTMCKGFGLEPSVKQKPSELETFCTDLANSDAAIVLVCKDDDDALWFYTNGHYVTLWEYDEETKTAFVSDSSGLFNRTRVDVTDVYKALKKSSDAQYMTINRQTPITEE